LGPSKRMISKIALISPYDSFEAHGLRSLSSYLRQKGVQTSVIFLPTYTELWQIFFRQETRSLYKPKILEQIRSVVSECDAVGITMMTMDRPRVQTLIKALKNLNKPIILGGVHPTAFPEDAIQLSDTIVLGEGYQALVDWCKDPDRNDIENMWIKRNGSLSKNPVRQAISEIDSLPFPDYGPDDHWVLSDGCLQPLNKELLGKFLQPVYHQFASLGCPFSCAYCINDLYKKMGNGYSKFRNHSVDYIIQETKTALKLSPDIKYIDFRDDGFIFMDEEQIDDFARRYRNEIGLQFYVQGIIPAYLTERKLKSLVDAGLIRTRLGLQSANTQALKTYKRPSNKKMFEKCNNMLQRYDHLVFPYYDVIVDNPFVDSEKDTLETVEFLLSLKGRFTLTIFGLRLYPGTELFEKAKLTSSHIENMDKTYLEYSNTLLNLALCTIQFSNGRGLTRMLLAIYYRIGNIKVPKVFMKFGKLLWYLRCSLEHFRKADFGPLPSFLAKIGSLRNRLIKRKASLTLGPLPTVAD
jgi:anaerobic magnesium-protoporphyrin IX monomethyl ester cyclase